MEQAASREQLRGITLRWRHARQSIALVPTMGNLHDGHLELLRYARDRADRIVASVFVNPTQFGPGEDFASYPRTLDADLRALADAGCDLAFVPDEACIYPRGTADAVRVLAPPSLSSVLEGANRPGHFDGVVTVVSRLFNLVGPDIAVFGEKDYQQLLVIRRMAWDLGFAVTVESVPTVREASGLAMSSRNRYLDGEQRAAAAHISASLRQAVNRLKEGRIRREEIEAAGAEELARNGLRVDYFAVRRAADLAVPDRGETGLRVLAAAACGPARLIDNMAVD